MSSSSRFDFDAAVVAPFRMQPGLRRLEDDRPAQFTPLDPASAAFAEKLAVLSVEPEEALLCDAGFDDGPACRAIAHEMAQQQQAGAFTLAGDRLHAHALHATVELSSGVVSAAPSSPLASVLPTLASARHRQAFFALALHEDLAVLDGASTRIRWLAVCLPSHWAPRDKIGRLFAEVHGPVADNAVLLAASSHLARLVCQPQRWERFVWNVSPHPRLDQHPRRHPPVGWPSDLQPEAVPAHAHLRTERQTFVPLPEHGQAVFTIDVALQPLAEAARTAERALRLHDAIASMSDAVLAYRGLTRARAPLLAWLRERAGSDGVR